MTNETKTKIGNDYSFAMFLYHFKEAMTNNCKYDYKTKKSMMFWLLN